MTLRAFIVGAVAAIGVWAIEATLLRGLVWVCTLGHWPISFTAAFAIVLLVQLVGGSWAREMPYKDKNAKGPL